MMHSGHKYLQTMLIYKGNVVNALRILHIAYICIKSCIFGALLVDFDHIQVIISVKYVYICVSFDYYLLLKQRATTFMYATM